MGGPLRAVPAAYCCGQSCAGGAWQIGVRNHMANPLGRQLPELTLAELFGVQVGRSPGAVAVCCGGVSLSYAELDERAGRLAGLLVSLGAGPGRLVAVAMERSVGVFVAWLGVAMSGAAFLPVDVGYPAGRVGFMLADAGPDVV